MSIRLSCCICIVGLAVALPAPAQQVPSTLEDFFQPGSQPDPNYNEPGLPDLLLGHGQACGSCHSDPSEPTFPLSRWPASMKAQAVRDPIFFAAMTIAEQDAAFAGELCLRCHAPKAWLEGRSVPTDGSALNENDEFPFDFEGVGCIICHRMVDPIADVENPTEDTAILNPANLGGMVPTSVGNAMFIIDPVDRRRGPFDLGQPGPHPYLISPFHRESLMCATCHDVSNPVFLRQGGPVPSASDSYVLVADDAAHPTQNKYDEFPVERTYSEWSQSLFAQGPVEMGGRFGGNITAVSTCQDCHMPDASGQDCIFGEFRDDAPEHNFNGVNSWVARAILEMDDDLAGLGAALHPNYVPSDLTQSEVDEAIARNVEMLELASDIELSVADNVLTVRIINMCGHKLPSGYPEGRRMWINVQFFDAGMNLVGERGAYDEVTATLDAPTTKVYQVLLGLDATVAAATGNSPGVSFHFVLSNTIEMDNRIPPMGFTNAGFESVQSAPVGATYADGQNWDDTDFTFPCAATMAVVRVFHQTTSREYVEFLRDENVTDGRGQLAFDLWQMTGQSAPVLMDEDTIALSCPPCNDNLDCQDADPCIRAICDTGTNTCANHPRFYGDLNHDGFKNIVDLVCEARVAFQGLTVCSGFQLDEAEVDYGPNDAGCGDGLINIVDVIITARIAFQNVDDICCGFTSDQSCAEVTGDAPHCP